MKTVFVILCAMVIAACSANAPATSISPPILAVEPTVSADAKFQAYLTAIAPPHEVQDGLSAWVVVADVKEYAEQDIASRVIRPLAYHESFVVTACTWIIDGNGYTQQIWLTMWAGGYVPAVNTTAGSYLVYYNWEKCEKVIQ